MIALVLLSGWLTLPAVAQESAALVTKTPATATFSMYCYWTGEATLGRVDGVLATRIGHWGGAEIVQVDFDPSRVSVTRLALALDRQGSFDALVAHDAAEKESLAADFRAGQIAIFKGSPDFIEAKYSLRTRHPELYSLGLSEQQAIVLNSWSYFGGSMPDVLSEVQKAELAGRSSR